ncbi:MAG: AMP-binding protein [Candidatus Hydrogenedentes bacterium]|nr:AMP-binding protein [Candidatus Hydrogenedentota bacterium]
MRVIDYFDRGVLLNPGGMCLHDLERGYSYLEVQEQTHRIANGLLAQGVSRESIVAIYSPNSVRAFECVLGAMRAGATWLPVNVRYSLEDNQYILGTYDCSWLFFHSSFEEDVRKMREHLPQVRHFICMDRASTLGPSFDAWIAPFQAPAPLLPYADDDMAVLFTSGGTTGRPKGVMLTHRNLGAFFANWYAHVHSDGFLTHLVAAPITHAAGLILLAMLAGGASNVIMPGVEADALFENIERFQVSILYLPPAAIYKLLAHPAVGKADFSSLQYFIYGAAPMNPDKLREAIEVFGPVMQQIYGQAETTAPCTCLSKADHFPRDGANAAKRLWSCGRPVLTNLVCIMDDDGRILKAGEMGEIVVRGSNVMRGYYKHPEETARVSEHGWHHTGDVGYCDEEGFFYLVDRKKDMIVSGGFNVYSVEVEQVLLAHPAVLDGVVIGVPDATWGEAIKAVVELKPDVDFDAAEVLAFCRERLGGVKTPKSVDVWEQIPRSPAGKLLKRDVRSKYWQDQERMIH